MLVSNIVWHNTAGYKPDLKPVKPRHIGTEHWPDPHGITYSKVRSRDRQRQNRISKRLENVSYKEANYTLKVRAKNTAQSPDFQAIKL